MSEIIDSGNMVQGELFPNIYTSRERIENILSSYPQVAVDPNIVEDLYSNLQQPKLFPSHILYTDQEIANTLGETFTKIDDEILEKLLDMRNDEGIVHYLYSPSGILGGRAPITLLLEDGGKEELLQELGRIEHGIF